MIVTCPSCGAKNRIDPAKAAHTQPVCGKCHAPLSVPAGAADTSHPIAVTDATFADLIRTAPVPVLVDCWAPWCGPCRALAPTLDQLAAESGGRYVVAKLNTDENPRTAGALQINAIPTLLIYKGGRLVDRIEGLAPKQTLASRLVAAG